MKKLFSLLLMAMLFVIGGGSAWAAGYTRTLNDKITVSGYTFKALYNFQTNTPEVLPTTGDLRYRDGNIWGLHNFGSGTRSAAVSITVSKGDLIILQDYNGTATVTGCSANAGASTSTGYLCFDVAADATSITISTPRYGGVVAAVVMSKDNNVTNADYTVTYKCGETVLSSSKSNGVVGEAPVFTKDPIWNNGDKYIYVSDDLGEKTIASDNSTVVTVQYRLAETYTYNVVSNVPGVNYSGSGKEGESVTVAVPRYINNGGTLYETPQNGSDWYRHTYTFNGNINETITYNATALSNVVFYGEAEELTGASSGNGNPTRTSMGLTGFGTDLPVTTLDAGVYRIYLHGANGNSAARAITFNSSSAPIAEFTLKGSSNNQDFVSPAIILADNTDITLTAEGSSASGVDYFYIVKLGETPQVGDITYIMTNPTIDGNINGWTCDKISGGNGPLKDNAVMEYWAGNATNRDEAGFDYHQTINNLPNGYYAVSAEMYNSLNGEAGAEFNQSCGVYGNGDIAYVTVEGNTLNRYTVITNVTNGTLRLGVKSDKRMGARWFVADNFRLTYLGDASATMTVNATAKYGTFCAPFDVEVPAGVTASIAAINANGTTIDLASVGETILANTPVILYAEDGLAATAVYGKAVAGTPTFGCLTGVYEDTQAPVGSYVLQMNDGVTGFYHVEDVQPTIGANRCYIPAPSVGARVRALYFGEKVTGINASEADDAIEAIYNANGIEVSAMQPGLNIVKMKSGKVQKVLVK